MIKYKPKLSQQEAIRLAIKIKKMHQKIAPLVPDIDPGDLDLILERLLRRPGRGRRVFIDKKPGGDYSF